MEKQNQNNISTEPIIYQAMFDTSNIPCQKKIKIKMRYTLGELLANTDFEALKCEDEQAWLNIKPRGEELL